MTCFGNKYRSACHMNIETLTVGENLTMRLLALALAFGQISHGLCQGEPATATPREPNTPRATT